MKEITVHLFFAEPYRSWVGKRQLDLNFIAPVNVQEIVEKILSLYSQLSNIGSEGYDFVIVDGSKLIKSDDEINNDCSLQILPSLIGG